MLYSSSHFLLGHSAVQLSEVLQRDNGPSSCKYLVFKLLWKDKNKHRMVGSSRGGLHLCWRQGNRDSITDQREPDEGGSISGKQFCFVSPNFRNDINLTAWYKINSNEVIGRPLGYNFIISIPFPVHPKASDWRHVI